MLIKTTPRWTIPEREATPEHIYWNRRKFLTVAGSALAGGGTMMIAPPSSRAESTPYEADPSATLYPVPRNDTYRLDRPLTDELTAASYNNFYEFGSHKQIAKAAQRLPLRPWEVVIDGEVEKEITLDIDKLLAKMPLEERLYRHRCVEAWSMAVPWSGFPLKALVDFARPLQSARYIRFQTFKNRRVARGQLQFWFPWPYTEGLTLDEAANDLAFMATGIYGHPLPKQHGAPVRLVVPWKYGFKSIKSVVRISFTRKPPKSFWQEVESSEYGFWANVNPDVPHPRWSQEAERLLGTDRYVRTKLFNGYAEEVAHLYGDGTDPNLYR